VLGPPVEFATDTVGESARRGRRARRRDVALLENLRFNPGETSKDDAERGAFADQLAASPRLRRRRVRRGAPQARERLRRPAAAAARGRRLVLAEVEVLHRPHRDTGPPYVVVLGGSKVSDKLGVIDNLLGTSTGC
jgi:phosphoglycerate kinase